MKNITVAVPEEIYRAARIYAAERDSSVSALVAEAERTNDILAATDLALSVQVPQEFYVQATRASRRDPLTHSQAVKLVESFLVGLLVAALLV
jgi:hypothetical protein